ncbi:MAG: 4'-phosphopantetheinyl transferase family protein [Candidatus Sulfotelmatobacter sp.]
MNIYRIEQSETDVPTENEWLSAKEKHVLSGLHFAKRNTDWRLGRWTAKRLLAACLHLRTRLSNLANLEILAAPSGAPEVFLFNQRADVTISLSHRAGRAIAVVALRKTTLGCDLEVVEPRSSAFVSDYFTDNEQTLIDKIRSEKRSLLITLCWSAKESALKAMREGLRLDTKCVEVFPGGGLFSKRFEEMQATARHIYPDPAVWHPLRVRSEGGQVFEGCWRHTNQFVETVLASLKNSGSLITDVELEHSHRDAPLPQLSA